jgi:predicted nucleotidyltransferase
MNKSLLDISAKIDRNTVDAIETINSVANTLDLSCFIVGAIAREFLLEHVHNIAPYRATLDIDLGVRVSKWDHFERLKQGLIKTGRFKERRELNRLEYLENFYIDLIPFGPIADSTCKVSLPPKGDTVMNVLGFDEAFQNSVTVTLRSNPLVQIRVATLAGLVVMKLISWKDKYPERAKDQFDYVSAGARLLGMDMSAIMSCEVREEVLEVLCNETGEEDQPKLLVDMISTGALSGADFMYMKNLLEELKSGILAT